MLLLMLLSAAVLMSIAANHEARLKATQARIDKIERCLNLLEAIIVERASRGKQSSRRSLARYLNRSPRNSISG